jgi:threonine dehydrogenase-like Zn-dependent dehydrogenase
MLLDMFAQGKIHVDEMITHRFPARRAPEAYEKIRLGDASMIGAMLEWE